jgi:hypothetical protein
LHSAKVISLPQNFWMMRNGAVLGSVAPPSSASLNYSQSRALWSDLIFLTAAMRTSRANQRTITISSALRAARLLMLATAALTL